MREFIAVVLALLQFAGITIGFVPYDRNVDYGGTKYTAPVIESYLTLIDGGTSDYVIVRSATAPAAEITAAEKLQSYLRQMSGVTLPIITDTPAVRTAQGDREIVVGKTRRESAQGFSVDRNALGRDGFILKTVGNRLFIAGGGPNGTLYGVYTFLEEQLGCRWYTANYEVVPQKSTVKINAALNDTQIPSFEVRRNASPGSTPDYYAKTKVNTSFWTRDEKYGDTITFVLWDVTLTKLVPDSLFSEHPDYFAFRKDTGKRTTEHVCLCSEGALENAVVNARAAIHANNTQANHIHVGQKDNIEYCECEKCEALYEKYGSVSAPTIIFTNKLAERLEEEFPYMYFTFYSYNETRRPPTDMSLKCRDNVVPVLCGLHQACRSHPITECGTEDGINEIDYLFTEHEPQIAADFKNWTAVAKRTYIYDYTINFLNTAQFFSNFGTLQSTMKYMKDIGITGYIYNCGDGHEAAFNELRNYLLCRVQWNVDADVGHLMDEFLTGYYGAAGSDIRKIIDLQTAKIAATAHAFDFDWHYQSGFYSLSEIDELDGLWASALACELTEQQRFRVEKAQLSWRYFKANLFIGEFNPFNFRRSAEIEKLYDDFISHGVVRVTSFGTIPTDKSTVDFRMRPYNWR